MTQHDRTLLRDLEHLSNALQAGLDNFPADTYQPAIDAIIKDCQQSHHILSQAISDVREDETRNHFASVFFRTSINNLYDDLAWVRGTLENRWFHLRPSEIRELGVDAIEARRVTFESLFRDLRSRLRRSNPVAAREVYKEIAARLMASDDIDNELLSDVERSLEACDRAYEEYIREGINDQPILDARSLGRQRANEVLRGARSTIDGILTLISSNYDLKDFVKTFRKRTPTAKVEPSADAPPSTPLQPIPEPPPQDA